MLKKIAMTAVAGLLSTAFATATACETTPAPEQLEGGWNLVWSDEFNGDAIDMTKWSHEMDCWGGGNNELQCYVPWEENSFVKDGCLSMVAKFEGVDALEGPAWPASMREKENPDIDPAETKKQSFSSSRLRTKGKAEWKYGRIEARARVPLGQGLWSAIWMLPTDEIYGPWALSGEIDIMEAVNIGAKCRECRGKKENRVLGTIHYGGEWPQNTYKGKNTRLPKPDENGDYGFNTYAVEWTEGQIEWFLNGKSYGKFSNRAWSPMISSNRNAPFDQQFHLIMNLAIGGDLAGQKNETGVDLNGWPKTMQVDWVRVYQCDGDETGKACRS